MPETPPLASLPDRVTSPQASFSAEQQLVQPRRLARNSILTFATRAALILLGLVFVPLLIGSIGMEFYGLLGITWVVLGHISFMDLGFSAACTRFVSLSLAKSDPNEAARWAPTAMLGQVVLGTVAAAGLWAAAPTIANVLHIQTSSEPLAILTLRLFALVIPFELVTRSVVAVLEAAQRFGYVNGLAVFSALWTYAVYALAILRKGDFKIVVLGLVALRCAALLSSALAARRILPELFRAIGMAGRGFLSRARGMFGFGRWVTINSLVGPFLFYFDRWLVGVILGVASLPVLTVPFNLMMQLTIIPAAVAAPLFPAFCALNSNLGRRRAEELYVRSHRFLTTVLLPMLYGLFVWAPEILRLWMGAAFSSKATLTLRILVIGLSADLLAPISAAVLNASGRPDLLSRLYLAQLPFNFALLWWLVRRWGIEGAAAGFAVRTFAQTTALWMIVHHVTSWSFSRGIGGTLRRAAPAVVVLAACAWLQPPANVLSPASLGITFLSIALYGGFAGRFLLDERDRSFIWRLVRVGRLDQATTGG